MARRDLIIRGARTYWAVILAVVAMTALKTAQSLPGFLYFDDFAFRYWAATQSLSVDYLLQSYGGHVNPIGLFLQWVLQAWFPGSRAALAIVPLILYLISLLLFAAIGLRLTASRGAVAIGVIYAGLVLFGFEVTVWWAANIYAGPYQVFFLSGLLAALWMRGTNEWKPQALLVLSSAGMAFSFSRGVLGIAIVAALAAALPDRDERCPGVRTTWNSARLGWGASGAVAVLGGLLVISRMGSVTRPGFEITQIPGSAWNLLIYNLLPALWGGPWRWLEVAQEEWPSVVAVPAPTVKMIIVSAAATIAVIGLIWVRRPALRPLAVTVIGVVAAVLTIAGIARSGTLVASVAYRYTFDLVWLFALVLILVITPVMSRGWRAWAAPAAVLLVVGASAVYSTQLPARDWASNQARQYMHNAERGFSQIPSGQPILDQGVPFDLIHTGLMAPYANARTVFTPQPGAPVFADYAPEALWGFAPDGSVEKQDVEGPTSPPGKDPDCGYRVTDVAREIELDGELIPWAFYARVAYYSGFDTTLNLAVGGKIYTVPMAAGGIRAVYFPVTGPGDGVLVSIGTAGISACVTEVRIGNRVSEQTGEEIPLPVTKLPPEGAVLTP